MGSHGPGRKRTPSKCGVTPEEDALNLIARQAEAQLAAKRAARAEAREIRMKELERQQKEIYQVQKKYYGLEKQENKWGDIEQWMEDSEQFHGSWNHDQEPEEEEQSVGGGTSTRLSFLSLRSNKSSKKKPKRRRASPESVRNSGIITQSVLTSYPVSDVSGSLFQSNGYGEDYGAGSGRLSQYSGLMGLGSKTSSRASSRCSSPLENSGCTLVSYTRKGANSSVLDHVTIPDTPTYSGLVGLGSKPSSRASSRCASPLENSSSSSLVSYTRKAANSSVPSRNLDYVALPDMLNGSSRMSTLSSATLTSLGGPSSRRGSGSSSVTADAEASIQDIKEIHELKDELQDVETKYIQNLKDMKTSLLEMEEKYRKAMVSNAFLDNEKSNLMYEVDIMKDSLMELEEVLAETRRELEERSKDLEREKHAHGILQFQHQELKETLKQSEEFLTEIRQLRLKQDGFEREIADLQETVEWKNKKIGALEKQKEYADAIRNERDELKDEVVQLKDILKKHGIVLGPDLRIVGEAEDGSDTTEKPQKSSVLEIRLRKLVDERESLLEQVTSLQEQLKQRQSHAREDSPEVEVMENGADPPRDVNRQISDLRFKLDKSEHTVTALEQNVTRLEYQVTVYKSAAESAEKVEDELKAEKRKLQRELRSAVDRIEELESRNNQLSKKLGKMKIY